jgi:hypothetical protein
VAARVRPKSGLRGGLFEAADAAGDLGGDMALTDTAIRKAKAGPAEWKLTDEKGLLLAPFSVRECLGNLQKLTEIC